MSAGSTANSWSATRPQLGYLLVHSGAALFILLFVSFFVWKLYSANPIEQLHYPAQSSARIFERHLYFYEGFSQASALEERVYTFLFGSRRETLQEAALAYAELLTYFNQHEDETEEWNRRNTQLRYIIMLAELGRWDQFIQQLELLGDMPEETLLQNLMFYAYDQTEDDVYMPEIHAALRMLPNGWSSDYIRYRTYKRAGLHEGLKWSQGRLLNTGKHIRHDLTNTIIFLIVFMSMSVIALLALNRSKSLTLRLNNTVYDQIWSLQQGIRLLLYAATLGIITFSFVSFSSLYFAKPWIMQLSLLLASLPMFLLAHYYLLSPRKLTVLSGYGMVVQNRQFIPLLLSCLILIGIERTGSYAIAWLVSVIGMNPHWASGISEAWLWGKPEAIQLGVLNAVLIAPVVEEFGFRGLLFISLRSRFSFRTAALISACLFAVFHAGSLVSILTAFWSGLIWAWALERTRSLLPGIVSHIVANALAVYMVLTFYS